MHPHAFLQVEGLQVPMQAMSSAGLPPFIAHELCR